MMGFAALNPSYEAVNLSIFATFHLSQIKDLAARKSRKSKRFTFSTHASRPYSALMLAPRITSAHFFVSAAMNALNSAGE